MPVPAVLFGVDLGCLRHKAVGELPVRVREEHVMSPLSVIPKIVALRGQIVIVCRGSMVFGGLLMGRGGGVTTNDGTPLRADSRCERWYRQRV